MSNQVLESSSPAAPKSVVAQRESWFAAVRTVAQLEWRQRVRSGRWLVVLGIWTAVLAALTLLIRWSVFRAVNGFGDPTMASANESAGRLVFGFVALLVLSLGALVVPALSATSINGDRNAGILATLQTTLLTPAQIVMGKLAASWLVALALLGCATPFLVFAGMQGGTSFARIAVSWLIIAVTMVVICAIGLGWSAITARTSSSTLLTYLATVGLGLGLPVLFLISMPLVGAQEKVTHYEATQYANDGTPQDCLPVTSTETVHHTERSWWLLAASPYFVLADAAPAPASLKDVTEEPLILLRTGLREARLGTQPPTNMCETAAVDAFNQREMARNDQRNALGSSWAYGLGLDVAFGALMAFVAMRRLRAPLRKLPRGTRVA